MDLLITTSQEKNEARWDVIRWENNLGILNSHSSCLGFILKK